jgi:putative ATPase
VPLKLRNAPTPLMKSMGYSGGYKYPHHFEGNYVPEEYLPDELRGLRFYEPGEQGEEARIKEWLDKQRKK